MSTMHKMAESKERQRVIFEMIKSPTEKIKIQVNIFRGIEFVDLRVWTISDLAKPAEVPTRKGLTIKRELLPELIKGLEKALGFRF